MWLLLAFASAFFLGIYDLNKKFALTDNAVIPVLFLNTLFCSLFFLPALLISHFSPETLRGSIFYVPDIDFQTHLHILLKSFIVLISWGGAYMAIKNLPITLVSPIRATQPALVLLGALFLFGEKLNFWQFSGVLLAITCFFLYSWAGKKEGISFLTNKWIWCLFLAVLSGSASGLYDKYLIGEYDRMAVQVWYLVYQVFMMLPILLIFWLPVRKTSVSFKFRWTIIGISFFLCLSDFVYFYALSIPGSMISIISTIRRSSAVVSFSFGALLFHEKNIRTKAIILGGVLLGMFMLFLGSL